MPKAPLPSARKRSWFSLRTFLIAALVYGGLWAATFKISIWQLASRCSVDHGDVTWTEYPGGHVRVRYYEAGGDQFDEDGFTLTCPAPFFIMVRDDNRPKEGQACLWLFGWIVPLNEDENTAYRKKK